MDALLSIAGGYLLGSIPFGLILSALAGEGDIRRIGSGNIGATNVLRTGNKGLAALTLLLDAGKAGVAAALAGAWLGHPWGLVAAAAALIGHCYPVWLGFRGGKGVATFFGALLAVAWPVFVVAAAVWLAVARLSRHSSAGALAAAGCAPIAALLLGRADVAVFTLAIGAVILWRHRDNIARLRAGTESRIGDKPKTSPELSP